MITFTFYSDDPEADRRLHRILAILKAKYPGEKITVSFEPGDKPPTASSPEILTLLENV